MHFLTTEEVARILRISPRTLHANARKYDIQHARIGRRNFYRAEDIEAWVAEKRVPENDDDAG